ncbi:hypothetical protein DNL40_01815 [Xylanimonas oleitrophica]|uniref:Uncharacterized protein n=1 Tax=Xylanimonas oleitrophica TaxID=2607479 RepID=A0A2W5WVE9_9MICO|nr:hypothetical protein DNL40_01815 [Xylanimonas oleitrophica]
MALVAALAVLVPATVAAAVLVPAHLERQRVERLTALAAADARLLTDALEEARAAVAARQDAQSAARDLLDDVALPFTEAAMEVADEETAGRLSAGVEALAAVLTSEEQPLPSLAPDLDEKPLADVLAARYVGTGDDAALAEAERVRDAEVARLAAVAAEARAQETEVHAAARGYVGLLAAVAPAVVEPARATPHQHERAGEEPRARLAAAAAAVEELGALVPSDAATAPEVRGAALGLDPGAADRVRELGAAAEAVRASHAEVVAAEEAAARQAAARRAAAGSSGGGSSSTGASSGGSGASDGGAGCRMIPVASWSGVTMTFVCH